MMINAYSQQNSIKLIMSSVFLSRTVLFNESLKRVKGSLKIVLGRSHLQILGLDTTQKLVYVMRETETKRIRRFDDNYFFRVVDSWVKKSYLL